MKASTVAIWVIIMAAMVARGECHGCAITFFSSIVQLLPCRPAVAPFSTFPPSDACCNAVRLLGQPCICRLLNGPLTAGFDRSLALQLPDRCASNFEPCL